MSTENEGFTWYLALVDFIPVLLFATGAIVINSKLNNIIFLSGIIVCVLGGLGKVIWKIIMAFKKKDIRWLFLQMRVLMPLGFLFMIIGVVLCRNQIMWRFVFTAIQIFPANFFMLLGLIFMTSMFILAAKLDQNDARSNWIEQITNILGQGSFLLAIIFAMH